MDVSRKEREELNILSKEVFGVPSRWKKFLKGTLEQVTKTVIETVPGENGAESTTKETEVPVFIGKSKLSKMRYYSIEDIKNKLINLKKQRDEVLATIKAQEEENKKKKEQEELQKIVQEDGSGSAVS